MDQPSQPVSPPASDRPSRDGSQGGPQGMGPSQPGAIAPWLLILFIIVVLAGGGYLGWYFWSQKNTTTPTPVISAVVKPTKSVTPTPTATVTTPTTTTPTATTKTYTNTTYGFSFKYPKDWTATVGTSTNALSNALLSVSLTNAPIKDGTDNPGLASISIYESLAKLDTNKLNPTSLKDYLEKYAALTDAVYLNVATQKIGTLDGYSAKMGANQFGGGSSYFATLPSDKIIGIRSYDTGITSNQITSILSTFQFTP